MAQFGKLTTDGYLDFRLVNSVDLVTPVPGKVYTDLTVKYWLLGATSKTAYAGFAAADLKEAGTGDYSLNIGASEWSAVGNYEVEIACSGCDTLKLPVIVTAVTMQEFMAAVPAKPGDAMTLAADAIKATSYDESTAYPLALPDSGVSAIARLGG